MLTLFCDYVAKCAEDESWLDRVKYNGMIRDHLYDIDPTIFPSE